MWPTLKGITRASAKFIKRKRRNFSEKEEQKINTPEKIRQDTSAATPNLGSMPSI